MSFYADAGGGAPAVYGATFMLTSGALQNGQALTVNPDGYTLDVAALPVDRKYQYSWAYFESANGTRKPGDRIEAGDLVRVIYPLCGTSTLSSKLALSYSSYGAPLTLMDNDEYDNHQVFRVQTLASLSRYLGYAQDFQLQSYAGGGAFAIIPTSSASVQLGSAPPPYSTFSLRGPDYSVPAQTPPVNFGCGYAKGGFVSPLLYGALIILILLLVFMLA
jgi:hypothetical protein